MTDDLDLHARWPIFNSEVPVTTTANGLVGQGDGCAAWVDAVYLYSSFVLVRTCLIVRPDQFADDSHNIVSLVDGGDDIDGPAVETTVTLDDLSLSTADGTLHFGTAGASSSGRSEAEWWLPSIPLSRLEVNVQWPQGGLSGSIGFDASAWRTAASGALAI